MRRFVCGYLFDGTGLVALVRKSRTWMKGLLNGIGGKVEDGEDWIAAMEREFQEEAGHVVHGWIHFVTMVEDDAEIRFYFHREDSHLGLIGTADEPVGWFRVDLLPDDVFPSVRWLVPLAMSRGVKFPVNVEYRRP